MGDREGRREERTGRRRRRCKRKDCEDTFASKRELSQHMVTTHGYLPCPNPHCFKVFLLQFRLDKHFQRHGALPTESQATAEAGNETELTRNTLEYLREIGKLMESAESKSAGFARLSSQLLRGTTQLHYVGLALYLHALEVALSLPPNSPETQTTTLPDSLDSPAASAQTAVSIPISSLSPLSPGPEALVRGRDLLFQLHRRELKRKRRKTDRFTVGKEEYMHYKPKKMYKTAVISEKQAFAPVFQPAIEPETVFDSATTLICIETPCSLRFCTGKELVQHLEAAHYHRKPCN